MKTIAWLFAVLVAFGSGDALAQDRTTVVPMSLPESGFAPVVPGMTSVDIPFTVGKYDTMIFRAIAPVSGVALTILNPSGAVAVGTGSPLIKFSSGATLVPVKPGGVFTTGSISTPIDGTWKMRFTFPAATQKTYIFATWVGKSVYETGIVGDDEQYLTGETAVFGYLVTNNGAPMTGLSPTITITPQAGGSGVSQTGKDDGLTIDGKANDGLYSVSRAFTTAGKYTVAGNVSINTASGVVSRKAETTIEVIDPTITVSSSSVGSQFDFARNCGVGIQATLNVTVNAAGTYLVRGDLDGGGGRTASVGQMFTLFAGTQTVVLSFPMDLIAEKIGPAASYAVTRIHAYRIDSAGALKRALEKSNVGQYLGVLCVDPISIVPGISVTETLRGGLISSLAFRFTVLVQVPGTYDVTLRVVGPAGQEIELISLTREFVTGANEVSFLVSGEKFLSINGPYRVVSVIVANGLESAVALELGQTRAYSMNEFTGPPPRLGNISTRLQVLTGNDVMIGGFVIGPGASKTVVVRARGPSLIPFGITNALSDPVLTLYAGQTPIASNDDWRGAANSAEISASGFAPTDGLESAIMTTLAPGAYSAVVSGFGSTTGVGIVEVFEVDGFDTPLVNISTRGPVLTGNDVMIGGFIIQGSGPQTVVVRARGPSLAPFGITNALANPVLQLVRSSDQTTLAVNDNWQSASNAQQVLTSGFAPSNPFEAAILITLPPGAYTAIVTGAASGTGVGIVEVFAVP